LDKKGTRERILCSVELVVKDQVVLALEMVLVGKNNNKIFNKHSKYISQFTPDVRFIVSYANDNIIVSYKDYVESYVEAINRLEKSVENVSDPIDDLLVFPILFLCCHSLELCMKWMIYIKEGLSEEEREVIESHNFDSLEGRLKKNFDVSQLKQFEKLLGFMKSLDMGSFSFRYPESTKKVFCLHMKEQFYWKLDYFLDDVNLFIEF